MPSRQDWILYGLRTHYLSLWETQPRRSCASAASRDQRSSSETPERLTDVHAKAYIIIYIVFIYIMFLNIGKSGCSSLFRLVLCTHSSGAHSFAWTGSKRCRTPCGSVMADHGWPLLPAAIGWAKDTNLHSVIALAPCWRQPSSFWNVRILQIPQINKFSSLHLWNHWEGTWVDLAFLFVIPYMSFIIFHCACISWIIKDPIESWPQPTAASRRLEVFHQASQLAILTEFPWRSPLATSAKIVWSFCGFLFSHLFQIVFKDAAISRNFS